MVWTELHALCAQAFHEQKHCDDILERLAAHPAEAREEHPRDGTLPLHHLLKNDPPLAVVSKVVDAYPEALFEENDMGYFPLHVACRYGCNVETVEYLIRKNPKAAERRAKTAHFDMMNIVNHFRYGMDVLTCRDLVEALPEDHPNRSPLLELLERHAD